jgi:hypothetical protein
MRSRGQALVALLVAVGVVAGAALLEREVGARELGESLAGAVPSGAWFCPHGGGAEWETWIELANPGTEPVLARIRSLSAARPDVPQDVEVPAGATVEVPVPAGGRERATTVEYFGRTLVAGWVTHAAGRQSGVAAEPCLPDTGSRWFLPDGATQEQDDPYVVVTNPYATDAVISLTLFTERGEPIRTEDWTNVTLRPFHSAAFRLNEKALGEPTVSTLVEVSVGRVAAATMAISKNGGIRAAVGLPGAVVTQVLPGGDDSGRSDLIAMSAGVERVSLSGSVIDPEQEQPIAGLTDASPPGGSARTLPATTSTPSSLVVEADGPQVAFARRTYGTVSDQAATTGATEPAQAWVILPVVAGSPAHPGIVLANPGEVAATVTLRPLPAADAGAVPEPITVEVPPRSTVSVPKGFVEAVGRSAVVAVAGSGAFVPATASYARGREGYATYAVAVGVPIPDAWLQP